MTELPPPLFGDELQKRLSQKIVHEPIAEGLLYRNSSLMISSQPSVGKSVISIQCALQLANGLPLFGALYVPRPMRVWYIQMERPDTESLERIQYMTAENSLDKTDNTKNNLYLDVELQALNFLKEEHLIKIVSRGKFIKPDVIFIDPLYGIAQGLSKDEIGSNIAKIFTVLKKELDCCLWINHHTTKNDYEIVNQERVAKDDPFYGAIWLKAHVTASYLATRTDSGTLLVNKKDSHGNVQSRIELNFDHDTYLSTIDTNRLNFKERYKMYINSMFRSGKKEYYFQDALSHLGCINDTLRKIHSTPLFKDFVSTSKRSGSKTLYIIKKEWV